MPWLKEEIDCGAVVMVRKCFASNYDLHKTKIKTGNKTSPKQQAANAKSQQRRYTALANANFKKGDYFITYTFGRGKLPETKEECRELFDKHLRELRRFYKKLGLELKYIRSFEYREVRPHFHLLINNDGINLADLPKWEYGTPKIKTLDNREFHTIGEYFVKLRDEYESEHSRRKMCFKGDLSSSRNLFIPERRITVLSAPSWQERPQPKRGYKLLDETLENGYTTVEGTNMCWRYQSYVLIKEKAPKAQKPAARCRRLRI